MLSGRFQRSVSSSTWPCLLAWRGLASSAFGLEPTPRLELLVSATYTLPVTGLGSMSSGRSIFVAPTLSPARRVKTKTSSAVMPSTCETAPCAVAVASGIHSPLPSNSPSFGSLPVPSISMAGESPVSLAT
ncbi:hypothetical protein STENM223S_01598 [Streptomyces tendae]